MASDLNVSHGKIMHIAWVHFGHISVELWLKVSEVLWHLLIKKCEVIFEYILWENVQFCFIFLAWAPFSHKTEKFRVWKSLKYFNIFLMKKIWRQILLYLMENCLALFHFHFLVLLWNILILKVIEILSYFLINKNMTPDLNVSHGKIPEFVLFPLLGFLSVIKLKNFDFESHWKEHVVRSKYVRWKNTWFCFMSIIFKESCLILFHFHCLGSF